MNKFEYKIRTFNLGNTTDSIYVERIMNMLGDDGWELCHVDKDGSMLKCFFKRMIEPKPVDTGPR